VANGAALEDAACNGGGGAHSAWLSGREKAEELILVAFRWLATVEQFMCLKVRPKGRGAPSTVQKVQLLLAGEPPLYPGHRVTPGLKRVVTSLSYKPFEHYE
jgi:hypothetical protein